MTDKSLRQLIDEADHHGADIFFDSLVSFVGSQPDLRALDMFARNGDLTVSRYFQRLDLDTLDLWELNGEHVKALEQFSPDEIRIGCSYQGLKECEKKYNFVVVDSPQGVYQDGEKLQRVEHFDVMPQLGRILEDEALVVFYVNKAPYDREKVGHHGNDSYEQYNFKIWMAAREAFYSIRDGRELSEVEALHAYFAVFEKQGFKVRDVLLTPCFTGLPGLPPSFRLALDLKRVK